MGIKSEQLCSGFVYEDHGQAYLYLGKLGYKKSGKHVEGDTFIKLGATKELTGVASLLAYCRQAVVNKQLGLIQTEKGRKRLQNKVSGLAVPEIELSALLRMGSFSVVG